MDLNELYSELIVQYSQSKIHRRALEHPTVKMRGVNPSCGDDITLELNVEDNVIKDVGILGSGCAISEASAGMMAELIEGKTLSEANTLLTAFLGMIQKTVTKDEDLAILEEAQVLKNISNMPARVKCAVLSWHTLQEAMDEMKK